MSFSVWRPSISVSSDGEPLVTSVLELFRDFPYDRLPSDNEWVATFFRPEIVIGATLFYLFLSTPLLKLCIPFFGITGKSEAFKICVALHNAALAVFSFVVAASIWPVVIANVRENGLEATFCDRNGIFWHAGHGGWSTIFYLSKYWEFADTWILVLKGKKPSFLQVYHHAGIVLTMWGGVVTEAAWLLWIVLMNSVIHTFMYVYFLLKTVSPTMKIKAARYLTMAQIVQFYTGIIGSAVGTHYLGERCASAVSRLVLLFLQVYAVGLIVLFMSFASTKYKQP